jgi:hypothetical protein
VQCSAWLPQLLFHPVLLWRSTTPVRRLFCRSPKRWRKSFGEPVCSDGARPRSRRHRFPEAGQYGKRAMDEVERDRHETAAKVAEIGYRALLNHKTIVIPAFGNTMVAQSVRFSPRRRTAHCAPTATGSLTGTTSWPRFRTGRCCAACPRLPLSRPPWASIRGSRNHAKPHARPV